MCLGSLTEKTLSAMFSDTATAMTKKKSAFQAFLRGMRNDCFCSTCLCFLKQFKCGVFIGDQNGCKSGIKNAF